MVRMQLIAGVVLLLLGLGSIGGGLIVNNEIKNQLNKGIEDTLVIDGKQDPNYQDWITNEDPGDVPKYKKFYLWNLTNPDEYLNGDKPVFEELGPYVFRQYDRKLNVTFADNNQKVTFRTYTYYKFEPSLSSGSLSDKIININPAYQGVLAKAGSEQALMVGFVGPTLQQILDGFKGDFLKKVIITAMGTALQQNIDNLKSEFVPGVVLQAIPKVLTGIKTEVISQVQAIVNASIAVSMLLSNVKFVTDNATLFNNVTYQSLPFKSVANFTGADYNFSAQAINRILNGNATLGLPGWLNNPNNGTGLLGFLLAYQNESIDKTQLAAGYLINVTQLDVLANYIVGHLFNEVVPAMLPIVINATVAAQMINKVIEGLTQVYGTTMARNLFFNNTAFQQSIAGPIVLKGVANYTGTSYDFTNSSIEKILYGNALFGVPGWLTDLESGSGIISFLSLIQQDPSTAEAVYGLNSSQLGVLADYLTAHVFAQVSKPLSPSLFQNLHLTTAGLAEYFFLIQWTNGTGIEGGVDLTGDGIDDLSLVSTPDSTNITLAEAIALFDPTNASSFVNDTGILTWINASLGDSNARNLLKTTFNLTDSQLSLILNWLFAGTPNIKDHVVPPLLIQQFASFGVTELSDLAYLHWGSPNVTSGLSVKDLDPTLSGYPEYWAWASRVQGTTAAFENVTFIKELLNGTHGFFNGTEVGVFLTLLANGNFSTIQSLWGLSQTESSLMAGYLAYFNQTFVIPGTLALFASAGVTELVDLAYLHWGSPNVTSGLSVKDFDPTLSGYPEYWAWASHVQGTTATFENVTFIKTLLEGSHGFTNSTEVGMFLTLLANGNFSIIQSLWGLDQSNAALVGAYLNYIMVTFVTDVLKSAFEAGGGLISTRTVNQWLWSYTDPLLALIFQDDLAQAENHFFTNQTSVADALDEPTSTFYTGKGNISLVNTYIKWHDNDTITVWKKPEKVRGTDGTQFHPEIKKEETLITWVGDLLRAVKIVFKEEVSLHDITLYRFVLADDVLAINPDYYQSIRGFANMTSSVGIPLFLSKPHFLDADQSWLTKVSGLVPDEQKHDTFLDVEPTTGVVMHAAKRLQINILTDATDVFYPNITKTMMPILWVEEGGEIPEDLANDFRDTVYGARNLQSISFTAGMGVGLILLIAGGAVTVLAAKKEFYV